MDDREQGYGIPENEIRRTAGILMLGGTATANDDIWFGVKAGTLGFGAEAAWRPLEWLDVRAGANFYDYDDSGSQAGINYDATLALDTST